MPGLGSRSKFWQSLRRSSHYAHHGPRLCRVCVQAQVGKVTLGDSAVPKSKGVAGHSRTGSIPGTGCPARGDRAVKLSARGSAVVMTGLAAGVGQAVVISLATPVGPTAGAAPAAAHAAAADAANAADAAALESPAPAAGDA